MWLCLASQVVWLNDLVRILNRIKYRSSKKPRSFTNATFANSEKQQQKNSSYNGGMQSDSVPTTT